MSDAPVSEPRDRSEGDDDEPLLDAREDEAIARAAPWWDAGGPAMSAAFWGAIAVMIAALFRTQSLPFCDYPQHLALAATLRRMLTSGAPERALFETNVLSYNSLFHVVVAALNVVVPIDVAGKIVLGAYAFLLGYGSLALLRATGRPRARAFLILPVFFGYSIVWGFVNFGLGAAIQLIVLARVLEHTDPRRHVVDPHPIRRDVVTAIIALLGAYTHLLASALVYLLLLVAIVVRTQTAREGWFLRVGRAFRIGAPLLVPVAYCVWVYRRQMTGYQNFEYAVAEGNDSFALVKVKGFIDYAAGLRTDGLDGKVLSIALGLLVLGAILRDPDDDPHPALRWLFVASGFAYLIISHVFWATNFVFERVSFFVVITAVLMTPRALPKFEAMLRLFYVSVGLAAAGTLWGAMGAAHEELADFDRVIAEMPRARRVTGLVWHPKLESTLQWSLVQSPAYYVARNGGEVAFSFTRTMSLPVHYRKETMPPDPPANFEWMPQAYRPSATYAKYFDLVLMKTTDDDGVDPRAAVWGAHAGEVDVVVHHGRWWAFETKRVTADAPSPSTEDDDAPSLRDLLKDGDSDQ
ncbi:MAG: hypothetical protein ACHREM_12590 [Polyangiales bacterium]